MGPDLNWVSCDHLTWFISIFSERMEWWQIQDLPITFHFTIWFDDTEFFTTLRLNLIEDKSTHINYNAINGNYLSWKNVIVYVSSYMFGHDTSTRVPNHAWGCGGLCMHVFVWTTTRGDACGIFHGLAWWNYLWSKKVKKNNGPCEQNKYSQ